MNSRAAFYDREALCQHYFEKLGKVYHLCTPENHPIIFRNTDEFARGMSLLAIAQRTICEVNIITFELMNNHLHLIVVGDSSEIALMFECYRKLLQKCLYLSGGTPDLKGFIMHLHEITSLENLRNAIAYANRNGAVVDRDVCPYTYPWGANRFFFNPEAKARYESQKSKMSCRDKRAITRSHKYDNIDDLYLLDGYVSPLSFCLISEGEKLFRDARHYFTKVSRHIECYDEIAKMIGEQIYYTDDDLFSIACALSLQKFNCRIPSQLSGKEKIDLAKILNREYNAGIKQLQRMLKIDQSLLISIFGNTSH